MAISFAYIQEWAHSQSGQAISPLRACGRAGCQTGSATHATPYGHKGHEWELYCTAEGYGHSKVLHGVFSRVELLRYFDEVQFEVDADFFEELGIYLGETVSNLDEYR